ncbi:methyltransferase-like protein 25B isoform X2 [Hyalella azteca]|uniref:Methyltransferase-like protein 25B isoform X2 n=1 Tax=Hyalella azteca TaxID=294128 RepID=A0A8B7PJ64_HYAAZ|nr:methyltransferase-like protein 25B isoform X2 [Hyalella azteca]
MEFFCEDLWSKVPKSWQDALSQLSPPQLATILQPPGASNINNKFTSGVLPLSLLAFQAAAFRCSLPRNAVSSVKPFIQYLLDQQCDRKSTECDARGGLSTATSGRNDVKLSLIAELNSSQHQQQESGANGSKVVVMPSSPSATDDAASSSPSATDHTVSSSASDDAVPSLSAALKPAWPSDDPRSILWQSSHNELCRGSGGHHTLMSHVFRRHLKPKKQHEVARLGLVAAMAAASVNCDVTADIGSGCGHLARLMAYGYNMDVVCVDREDDFVVGARKFDAQLEQSILKLHKRIPADVRPSLPAGPKHVTCDLHPGVQPQDFTQRVLSTCNPSTQSYGDQPLSPQHSSLSSEEPRSFGLTGLHTCGDLATTVLRVFLASPHCRYIASVSCCYMKLSEPSYGNETDTTAAGDKRQDAGYPASRHCRRYRLTYAARELACHAIEAYACRLAAGDDNLKVHCYRAALEQILVRRWPEHRRAGLRPVKHAHTKPFQEYARRAVKALAGGTIQLLDEDLSSPETEAMLARWRQVIIFYTLRLLLAPVIETVVLLDRCFFLYENDVNCALVPSFDPQLSPRNMILLATKPRR